jgi:hypothetical protein
VLVASTTLQEEQGFPPGSLSPQRLSHSYMAVMQATRQVRAMQALSSSRPVATPGSPPCQEEEQGDPRRGGGLPGEAEVIMTSQRLAYCCPCHRGATLGSSSHAAAREARGWGAARPSSHLTHMLLAYLGGGRVSPGSYLPWLAIMPVVLISALEYAQLKGLNPMHDMF